MTAHALRDRLTTSGARLFIEDDRLRIRAPVRVLTDDLVEEIRANKAELMQLLQAANDPPTPKARHYTLTIDDKQISVIATDQGGSQEADFASAEGRWGARLTCIEAHNPGNKAQVRHCAT